MHTRSRSLLLQGAPSQQTRHARRLYVGGLGESTEREIGEFFSDLVRNAAVTPPKANPVLSVYINAERKFAFVEFSSIELANAIMQVRRARVRSGSNDSLYSYFYCSHT